MPMFLPHSTQVLTETPSLLGETLKQKELERKVPKLLDFSSFLLSTITHHAVKVTWSNHFIMFGLQVHLFNPSFPQDQLLIFKCLLHSPPS